MTVLILGSTGFLGRNLVDKLVERGNEVICVIHSTKSLQHMEHMRDKVQFWNLADLSVDIMQKAGIDAAYNLACRYIDGISTKMEIVEANYQNPARFLFDCLEAEIPRFITIGTGLPDDFNLYAITKRQFAELGKYYAAEQKRQGKVFKFCNVELERFFGEGEPDNRFVPAMIRKLIRNEELLLTQGDQKRDFIYIDDVLDVLMQLAEIPIPEYMDLPLGSGQDPTVREVIEYLHDIIHSGSEMNFGAVSKRFHEPDSVADLTMLKQLGLQIHYTWQEGMEKVVQYYLKLE